ncbi:MAG: hypothetical protein EBZ76_09625 [Synechococcaceae bacterium WB9_2_170]|nr:hypothetical protein [Synechococcaceae bacterium WB9_2_170]
MAHPSLSGVAPERVIELGPGLPALTVDQANRLILRHGLNRNDDDSIPDSFSDNKVDLWGRRFFKKNTLELLYKICNISH